MPIKSSHMRLCVIRPALKYIGLWSKEAENLLMGTAAQESHMGTYLKQKRGPALGAFQMEPRTYSDIWENYLTDARAELKLRVRLLASAKYSSFVSPPAVEMIGNLQYAAAMARIFYLRIPKPLPKANDVTELGVYWKKYYNTILGHGTVQQFAENWYRFIKE